MPGKRDALPSTVVADMIDKHRKALGISPRKLADTEIVQRLVYALVNEGAHVLEDKIAARAGDIDIVYLTGYGFPAWRGGPMCYADRQGLFNVVRAMQVIRPKSARRRRLLEARAAARAACPGRPHVHIDRSPEETP